jgi:hypothetical protein
MKSYNLCRMAKFVLFMYQIYKKIVSLFPPITRFVCVLFFLYISHALNIYTFMAQAGRLRQIGGRMIPVT